MKDKVSILVSIHNAIEEVCHTILLSRNDKLDNVYGCGRGYEDTEVNFIIRRTETDYGCERQLLVNGWGTRPEESIDELVCDASLLADGPARASLLAQLVAWAYEG